LLFDEYTGHIFAVHHQVISWAPV